jgi:hypothetical protein
MAERRSLSSGGGAATDPLSATVNPAISSTYFSYQNAPIASL